MKGTPANYLGRLVSKENFRAFIYSPDGQQKLVESWNEYEINMASGIWFPTLCLARNSVASVEDMEEPAIKPKPRKKRDIKPIYSEEILQVSKISDSMGFEVKNDECCEAR